MNGSERAASSPSPAGRTSASRRSSTRSAASKVAITSTCRTRRARRIFGVANGPDWQLVLVDLPGFQRPMDALTERMQETVDASFEDVDAVLLVVAAREPHRRRRPLRRPRACSRSACPVVIALNKIDRLKPGHIASQMKAAAAARRLPRAPPGEREDRRRRSASCATTSSRCCPRARRTSRRSSGPI